jgi:hypothetical protein
MKTKEIGLALATALSTLIPNLGSAGPSNQVTSPDEGLLRSAIAQGGWVGIAFNGTLTLENPINITNDVVLDGTGYGAAISGGGAVRLFYVAPGASLTLSNLSLVDGSVIATALDTTADGGAVYNDGGNVSAVDCNLTGNSVQSVIVLPPGSTDVWRAGLARGGAIFNNGGTVSLCGSVVSSNSALAAGHTTFYASTLRLALGGAFYTTNGTCIVSRCTIAGNSCSAIPDQNGSPVGLGMPMGGAVYQAGSSLIISNTVFAWNIALGGPGYEDASGSPAFGGALSAVAGDTVIEQSRFCSNSAVGGMGSSGNSAPGVAYGGAVYSVAAVTIADSTFSGNVASAGQAVDFPPSADAYGGALFGAGNTVLNRCLVCSNSVQGGNGGHLLYLNGGNAYGGGIFNAWQLSATNCTVALNSALGGAGASVDLLDNSTIVAGGYALGGGVFDSTNGILAAANLTVASNLCFSPSSASYYTNGLAGGVQMAITNGIVSVLNTLVAYGGTNGNVYGVLNDDGYNMSSDDSANFSTSSSFNDTDPKLAPLGDNGGPTLTMALLPGSPAIDEGDPADYPVTDQRGYFRPAGSAPDIGAFESGSAPLIVPSLAIHSNPTNVWVSFTAVPPAAYHLQYSTNLAAWSDLYVDGPFAAETNINRTINPQFNECYFRLLLR